MELSIIFPAYNEAERIGPTLKLFSNYLSAKGFLYEILVVDDGSTDNTISYIESLKIPNCKVIPSVENKGKGHAVRIGMLAAKGKIRVFSDADGSTPIEEIDKLLAPLNSDEADIAIGSRYLENSEVTKAQPFMRVVWSRFTNKIMQRILLPGIADPHCGFKAFRAEAAEKIFPLCKINEWSFDLEVLSLAQSLGFKIKEIPVKWANDERSKGKFRQLPKEVYNVYKIRKSLQR